ncbi:MAG: hypothetical protein Q7T53_02715 [Deltaproteobacteria bacterium]|nr:hypothetical protein [Deltaproteobacteria bacterium]
MLNVLKNIESDQAERTLAALVKHLTPQPTEGDVGEVPLHPLEATLLDEIRQRAKVSAGDLSQEAKAKLLEIIVKEISQPVLGSTRAIEAKARLGMRGDLRPDLYQIKFGDSFKEDEKRGVRRSHVEETIHHPDKVEHLLPNRFTDAEMPSLSLYAKTMGKHASNDIFTLIVQTQRQADKQLVSSVWRVYHSDVDLSHASSPLGVLKAFVSVYAMDFYIGDKTPRHFLLYDTFNLPHSGHPFKMIEVHNPGNDNFVSSFMFRISPLAVAEVAIAYVINTTRYIRDLRKHNVQIAPDVK